MKNLWKGIKNILNMNKKEDSRISQLSHNGKNINNNLDMANSFNEFFTEVGPKLNKQIPNSNLGTQMFIFHRDSLTLYHYTTPLLRKLVKLFLHYMIPNHQVLHLFLSNY